MALDPRLQLINFNTLFNASGIKQPSTDNCLTVHQQNLASTNSLFSLQNILSGENAIGEFQMLPQGGGSVGAGLASLVALSDQIRVGGTPSTTNTYGLPTTDQSGLEFVLNKVGLSSQSIAGLVSVNGLVANAATQAAANVYNHVQQGTFTTDQLNKYFSAFQNASALTKVIYHAGSAIFPQHTEFGTMCGAKQYALDLIKLAPKYKFLFVVQFEFNPEFHEVLSSIDPAFVVKHTTRPNVRFELEPVNFYNFRTAVAKKTTYEPMHMKFYDDDYNNIFQFYNTYLKLYSPIANIDIESAKIDPLDAFENVGGGMGFNQPQQFIQPGWSNTVGQGYAGSLGPLGTNPSVRNALRRISIFHVYKQGRMMNVYHFYNPKITQLHLDELEMGSAGDGSDVGITFEYDSVYIIPGYRVLVDNTKYDLNAMTNDGVYPFGAAPGSVTDDGNPKDGIGRGGIGYGQDILMANTLNNETTQSVQNSIAAFQSENLKTLSGSSLGLTIPNIPGGGNNTSTSLQSSSLGDLQTVSVTAKRIADPITGTVQDSADNSGNLGSVLGQNVNQVSAAQQLTSTFAPQTLAQSVDAANTVQSVVSNADSELQVPSSTFTGGGGSFDPNAGGSGSW